MRILHVTHEMPPRQHSGTALQAAGLAAAQAERHEVAVFAHMADDRLPAGHFETTEWRDLPVRWWNRPQIEHSPLARSYEDTGAGRALSDWMLEVRPEIIHVHHLLGLGIGVLEAARTSGAKLVMTLHDYWPMCPIGQRVARQDREICDPIDFSKCGGCLYGSAAGSSAAASSEGSASRSRPQVRAGGWRDRYRRRYEETPGRFLRKPRAAVHALRPGFIRRARAGAAANELPFTSNPFEHRFALLRAELARVDLGIAPSAFLRDQYRDHFRWPARKLIHLAHGHELHALEALPKTPSKRTRIGFFGSLIPTKGPEVLLDAAKRALAAGAELDLVFHGAAPAGGEAFASRLQEAAGSLEGRVRFAGAYRPEDLPALHRDIDLCVVPSTWYEIGPLTMWEAARLGTPLLVSDRAGMLEFVQSTGYGATFPLGKTTALAKCLVELSADPAALSALGGGPPPMKPMHRAADELISIYADLIDGRFSAPDEATQARTRGGILQFD